MHRLRPLLVALPIALLSCTPGPDRVCAREANLTAESLTKRGLMVTDDDKRQLIDRCTARMEKTRSDNSDRYKCQAKCVMDAKERDEIEPCSKGCP